MGNDILQVVKTEVKFVLIIRFQSSTVASVNNPTREIPALFTRQSILEKVRRDCLIISSTKEGSLISPQKDKQDTFSSRISFFRDSSFSGWRKPWMITFHPCCAKYMAVSRPIPLELPVMSTVFIENTS